MKRYLFVLMGLLALFPRAVLAAEESIVLTTYYPSPYGVYGEMRLYPKASAICNDKQEGLMYYNSVEHALKICVCKNPPCPPGGFDWMLATGYWAASPFNSNNIYNTNSGNVGIGTNDPKLPLHVKAAKDGWLMALQGPPDKFTAYGLTSDFITGWGIGMWGKSTAAPTAEDFGVGYYNGASWSTPFMIDKAIGNVGIGTTNPQAKLHIRASSDVDGVMLQGGLGIGKVGWTRVSSVIGADQGGIIELGAIGPSVDARWYPINPVSGGTPYIDMHYGNGLAEDYNVRIINSGNNMLSLQTKSGGAVLTVNGGNVGIGTTAPNNSKGSPGYLDAKDVYLRDAGKWASQAGKPALSFYELNNWCGPSGCSCTTTTQNIGTHTVCFLRGVGANGKDVEWFDDRVELQGDGTWLMVLSTCDRGGVLRVVCLDW